MSNHKIIWLTGLPSAGKTTIAQELNKHLDGIILDGDEIRDSYISMGLGFSQEDRETHLMRVADVAKIAAEKSHVICSFVSPSELTRQRVAQHLGDQYFEVFVKCHLGTCIKRDVKGLYKKALNGEIPNFTGITAPYDAPLYPDLIVNTDELNIQECTQRILDDVKFYKEKVAMYIGRWNGVFHRGHEHIVQEALDADKHVMLAVREVQPDENNPWTASEVKIMLEYFYEDEPRVRIITIPDIESVNYGRGVGYSVNELKVTNKIAGISGTDCRKLLAEGAIQELEDLVPGKIIEYLNQTPTG